MVLFASRECCASKCGFRNFFKHMTVSVNSVSVPWRWISSTPIFRKKKKKSRTSDECYLHKKYDEFSCFWTLYRKKYVYLFVVMENLQYGLAYVKMNSLLQNICIIANRRHWSLPDFTVDTARICVNRPFTLQIVNISVFNSHYSFPFLSIQLFPVKIGSKTQWQYTRSIVSVLTDDSCISIAKYHMMEH